MKFNIATKVYLLIVSLILVLGGLLGWYSLHHERRALSTELDERAGVILDSLVLNAEYPILIGDEELLAKVVGGAMDQKDVIACEVHDAEDKVLFAEVKKTTNDSFTINADVKTLRAAQASAEDMLLGTTEQVEELVGCIHLTISRENLKAKLADIRLTLIVVVVAVIVATGLASSLLLKLVLGRPIAALMKGAQRIAQGDLNYQVAVRTNDEIGKLAEAFNRMTRDLSGTLVSREYVNNIIASMVDSLIVIDSEGKIKTVNQAALELLDYQEKDIVGQPAPCVLGVAFESVDAFRERIRNERIKNIEAVYRRRNGAEIPVLFSASAMLEGDKLIGFVCVAQDITERRELESQLRQAQKLESIGQLAAGIAHEINTPAQYVGDNTRFLQEAFTDICRLVTQCSDTLGQAKDLEAVDAVRRQVENISQEIDLAYLIDEIPRAIDQSLQGIEHVARIVKAMKEFAHPGVSDKTDTDINRAIENTVTIARNEWKYVSEIEMDLDPDLPMVPCLPGEMNQVFLNLIINAAQAIAEVVGDGDDKKGIITISTRHGDDYVEIRIQDTGAGIPDEIQTRIFDPFFTTKDVGKGTGQGLTICHAVVTEKHGGSISFESQVDQGTTFVIRLPLTSMAREAK
ncbi:MAG: PAS domain S-box protein [Sedimentisphaerales bacterium]|nr:PAS domain S-box protein [Sedimentisphaerales bacterium]